MTESRSLSELIRQTGANLQIVAAHFRMNVATPDELKECSGLLVALADALKLYAEKMPGGDSSGRHVLREAPD